MPSSSPSGRTTLRKNKPFDHTSSVAKLRMETAIQRHEHDLRKEKCRSMKKPSLHCIKLLDEERELDMSLHPTHRVSGGKRKGGKKTRKMKSKKRRKQ